MFFYTGYQESYVINSMANIQYTPIQRVNHWFESNPPLLGAIRTKSVFWLTNWVYKI